MVEENNESIDETPKEVKEEKKLDRVDEAVLERQKIDETLIKLKAENDRRESLLRKEAMGGTSEAGTGEEKPKEETDAEYVARKQKDGWKPDE